MDVELNIKDFPNEVIIHIISFLSIPSFQNLLGTSQFFSQFNIERVWKILAEKQAFDIIHYKPRQKDHKWLCLARVGSWYRIKSEDLVEFVCGEVNWSNIDKDDPEVRDCKPNGFAILKETNKVLSGYFKGGKLDGEGICWWNNGNRYEGEWLEGKQCGKGKFFWNDGDYYEGEWLEDFRHGEGKYCWPKGSYYEGSFKMNDLDGSGTYTWKAGYYKGNWSKSKRHGEGEIVWTNGSRFMGTFIYGKNNG